MTDEMDVTETTKDRAIAKELREQINDKLIGSPCRSTSAKPADKRSPQRTLQAHQTESRILKRPNTPLN